MEITRDTMRADGQTVGQAMDADAAFLRSIGIPAKDGQPTIDERVIAFRDKMRDAVLSGMDSIAPDGKGATDGDLSYIFPAIDAHAEKLFWRLWDQGKRNF